MSCSMLVSGTEKQTFPRSQSISREGISLTSLAFTLVIDRVFTMSSILVTAVLLLLSKIAVNPYSTVCSGLNKLPKVPRPYSVGPKIVLETRSTYGVVVVIALSNTIL